MAASLKSLASVAAVAGLLAIAGYSAASADPHPAEDKRGIERLLTENTLAYPGRKGEENLIHFGRFGNFDWYFPCQFESGDWSLDDDQTLSLTYHNSNFKPRQYTLERREDGIALIEPDSENTTVAQMLEGNHIPYF
jgi:hypothetical protein